MTKRSIEDSVPIYVFVPKSLGLEVKTLLLDPRFGRVRYGAMRSLITQLLAGWVEDKRKGIATVEPILDENDALQEFEND